MGTAAAFGAMAAQRSGNGDQASALLSEAEQAYQQLIDRNGEDLSPDWWRTAVFQIALQEANSTVVSR